MWDWQKRIERETGKEKDRGEREMTEKEVRGEQNSRKAKKNKHRSKQEKWGKS